MCLYLYCSGNGVPICVANDSQTSNAKLWNRSNSRGAHEMILGIGGGTSTSVSNIWSTRQSRLLINGLTISGNKKPGGYFQKRNWTSLTKGDSDGKEGQLISYVLECHMPSVAGGSR
jgi:hypothetical protein